MSQDQPESVNKILSDIRNYILIGFIIGLFMYGLTSGLIIGIISATAHLISLIYSAIIYDLLQNERPQPPILSVQPRMPEKGIIEYFQIIDGTMWHCQDSLAQAVCYSGSSDLVYSPELGAFVSKDDLELLPKIPTEKEQEDNGNV